MPWLPEYFLKTISQAMTLINENFGINPSVSILLCSSEELQGAVMEELSTKNFSEEKISKIYLKLIIGKYFSEKNEIWLLESKGDNLMTLIHELLHSIQKCKPNRENIVHYLTYKLTGSETQTTSSTIKEWLEIEKTYSFERIKKQLLKNEDCEDFKF